MDRHSSGKINPVSMKSKLSIETNHQSSKPFTFPGAGTHSTRSSNNATGIIEDNENFKRVWIRPYQFQLNAEIQNPVINQRIFNLLNEEIINQRAAKEFAKLNNQSSNNKRSLSPMKADSQEQHKKKVSMQVIEAFSSAGKSHGTSGLSRSGSSRVMKKSSGRVAEALVAHNEPDTPSSQRVHRREIEDDDMLTLAEIEAAMTVVLGVRRENDLFSTVDDDDNNSITSAANGKKGAGSLRGPTDPLYLGENASGDHGKDGLERQVDKFRTLLEAFNGEGRKQLISLFTIWRQSHLLFPQEQTLYFEIPILQEKDKKSEGKKDKGDAKDGESAVPSTPPPKQKIKVDFRNQFRQRGFLEVIVHIEKKGKGDKSKVGTYKKSKEQKDLETHVIDFVLKSFIDLRLEDMQKKLHIDVDLHQVITKNLWIFRRVGCHAPGHRGAGEQLVNNGNSNGNNSFPAGGTGLGLPGSSSGPTSIFDNVFQDKIPLSVHFCLMPTVQFLLSITGCQLKECDCDPLEEEYIDRRLNALIEANDCIDDRNLVKYHEVIRKNFPVAFVAPDRSTDNDLSLPSILITSYTPTETDMDVYIRDYNRSASANQIEINCAHDAYSGSLAKSVSIGAIIAKSASIDEGAVSVVQDLTDDILEVGTTPSGSSAKKSKQEENHKKHHASKKQAYCSDPVQLLDYECPTVVINASNEEVHQLLERRNRGKRNGLAELSFHHHQDVFPQAKGADLELEARVFKYKQEALFMTDYVPFAAFPKIDRRLEVPYDLPESLSFEQANLPEDYIASMSMSKEGRFVICALVDGRIFVYQQLVCQDSKEKSWRQIFGRKEFEEYPTCVNISSVFCELDTEDGNQDDTNGYLLFAVAYANGLVRRYILNHDGSWVAHESLINAEASAKHNGGASGKPNNVQDWINVITIFDEDNLIVGTENGCLYLLFSPNDCVHQFQERGHTKSQSSSGEEFLKQGITCIDLCRGRGTIAVGSINRSVTVWEIYPKQEDTGMLNYQTKILELTDHQNAIFAVAMSQSGNLIYAGGNDGAVTIWDAIMGKKLRVIHDVWSIPTALFPDCNIATPSAAADGALIIRSALQHQQAPEKDMINVKGIYLSDDSSLMTVVLHNGTVVFMDAKITDQQYDYQDPYTGWLPSRDFEKLVGSNGSSSIREITHHQKGSPHPCRQFISTKISKIRDMVICADELRTVIVGRENEIEFLDLKHKQSRKLSLLPLKRMQDNTELAGARIVATPEGDTIVATYGKTVMWMNKHGLILETVKFDEELTAVAVSDDGEVVVVGGVKGMFAIRCGHDADFNDTDVMMNNFAATTSSGSTAVGVTKGDGGYYLNSAGSVGATHRYGFPSCINAIAVSSDGANIQYILVGCSNSSAYLRKVVTHVSSTGSSTTVQWQELSMGDDFGTKFASVRHSFAVTSVALHNNYAFTASDDKKIIIWRCQDLSIYRVLDGHPDSIKCMSVCKELPILIAGCKSESAVIWFWPTGEKLKNIRSSKAKRSDRISAVAFSNDGKLIVTTAKDRQLVRLFVNSISDDFHHIYLSAKKLMNGEVDNYTRLPNFSERILKFLQNRDLEIINSLREKNPVVIREYLLERAVYLPYAFLDDEDEDSGGDRRLGLGREEIETNMQDNVYVLEALLDQFLKDKRNLPRLRLLFEVLPHLIVMKITKDGSWLKTLQEKKKLGGTNGLVVLPTELIRLILEFYSYLLGADNEDLSIQPDEKFWLSSARQSFSPFVEDRNSNKSHFMIDLPPLSDFISINDIAELSEEFPSMFIQFVNRLLPVRNYDVTIDRQHSLSLKMENYLLGPSKHRQPEGYWTSLDDDCEKSPDGKGRLPTESWSVYFKSLVQSRLPANKDMEGNDLVCPYILPLKDLAAWDSRFLEQVIDVASSTEDYTMFENPVVKALIEFKWQTYAGWRFYFDFAFICVWNVMVMVNAVLFAHDKHQHVQHHESANFLRIGILIMLGRLIFHEIAGLVVDLHENLEEKTKGWILEEAKEDAAIKAGNPPKSVIPLSIRRGFFMFKVKRVLWDLLLEPVLNDYFMDLPNFLDFVTYSTAFISIYYQQCYEFNGRDDEYFTKANAWGAVLMPLLGMNILHDLTGVPTVGPYIRMMAAMLKSSGSLLFILGIMVFVFSAAFMLLMDSEHTFRTFDLAFVAVFSYMFGAFEFDTMYDANSPTVAVCLLIVYLFVVAVILLNLLVAIMGSSQEAINERIEGEINYAKASFILEYEELMFTIDSFQHEQHDHEIQKHKENKGGGKDKGHSKRGVGDHERGRSSNRDDDEGHETEDTAQCCTTNCSYFCWMKTCLFGPRRGRNFCANCLTCICCASCCCGKNDAHDYDHRRSGGSSSRGDESQALLNSYQQGSSGSRRHGMHGGSVEMAPASNGNTFNSYQNSGGAMVPSTQPSVTSANAANSTLQGRVTPVNFIQALKRKVNKPKSKWTARASTVDAGVSNSVRHTLSYEDSHQQKEAETKTALNGWLREDGVFFQLLSFAFFIGFSGTILDSKSVKICFPTWIQVLAKEGYSFDPKKESEIHISS